MSLQKKILDSDKSWWTCADHESWSPIHMVLHSKDHVRQWSQLVVLISKVTVGHENFMTSSLVHTWLDSRPLRTVWAFSVESGAAKCESSWSLHFHSHDPTTITETPLLTTSETRVIAEITLHSDCNYVTCQARNSLFWEKMSGGRWILDGPCHSTSEHGTFDPLVRLQ